MTEDVQRKVLCDVLDFFRSQGAFPVARQFRLRHERDRSAIDALLRSGELRGNQDRYEITVEGIIRCGSPHAREELSLWDELLPHLQNSYRVDPDRGVTPEDLANLVGRRSDEVARNLTLMSGLPIWSSLERDDRTGLVGRIRLAERVLDAEPLSQSLAGDDERRPSPVGRGQPKIERFEITGYRPFDGFVAEPGDLTVIIGANSTGKSSLFDCLRFLSFAASNPLPPEIDPRSAGKALFHAGGPERISLACVVDMRQKKPLRYQIEIRGPIGDPRVSRERLETAEPLTADGRNAFVFLDFRDGKGVVRDQVERRLIRPEWTVQPNELALRRALDPTLLTLSRFQEFLSSWRFYSGFDVSASAAIRRPVPTEPNPTLSDDGANISAVLFSLMTEHPEAWQELETHLRSAVPGFQSITVKPRGGPGTVIAIWRERDVPSELTLADLSDGTLRLLCWATLCLSPSLPPLVCIDEPELGLHPRVLPVLTGLFRVASARSQILIATHSPYLLSQCSLDEIAVMRKDDGAARFLRPRTSPGLRREVEEIGGEALARLHISDELESRA